MKSTTKFAVLLLFFYALAMRGSAQIAPQIQGAGAPTNPCFNGGQQYVDQTNKVIYVCPNNGGNWYNIGLGKPTNPTIAVASADPATCSTTPGVGELALYYNTTSAILKVCSATNTWSSAGGISAPFTLTGTANNQDIFAIKRFTDSSPTGNFINFLNAAGSSVANLDVLGNLTANSFKIGGNSVITGITFDANAQLFGAVTVNSGNGLQAAQQVGNTVTLAAQNAAAATKGVLQLAGCFGGSATSPQTMQTVATHTGAGYTVVSGDACTTIGLSNAGSQTATLPNPIAANGTWYEFVNYGAGNWTISPNGLTMNPTATLVIGQNQSVRVVSDGTNYWYAAGRMVAGSTNTSEVVILDSNGNLLTSRAGAPIVRSAVGSDVTITAGITNANSVFGTGQNSGTNVAGHNTTITAGPGTGNAAGEKTSLIRPLMGASGTTTQSTADAITACESKTLSNTSATLTTLATIGLASNSAGGVDYSVTVTCSDGTNFDSDTQHVYQSFVNKAGTISLGTHQITASTAANNSGSCTIAATETSGASLININVTPVFTTIVPTTVTAYVELNNHGAGAVTCQ